MQKTDQVSHCSTHDIHLAALNLRFLSHINCCKLFQANPKKDFIYNTHCGFCA